jgi:thiamine biosynthesis lipoprotein
MGTRAHIVVVGGDESLADDALQVLDVLESRWSRFRPDSEISRLNAARGSPTIVSPITFELLRRAVTESHATGGAFDPTVLPALLAAGYDRDFAQVRDAVQERDIAQEGDRVECDAPVIPPGVSAVELDPTVGAVCLHDGATIDLGGIAKGFAADHVATRLLGLGASGACVNLGGDLRVVGASPSGDSWAVAVECEPGVPLQQHRGALALTEGGVATTSVRRRAWQRGGVRCHHVIDPRTGAPAISPWSSVTVLAGDATSAEIGATAALLSPDLATATAALTRRGAVGIAVDDEGAEWSIGAVDGHRVDVGIVGSEELTAT